MFFVIKVIINNSGGTKWKSNVNFSFIAKSGRESGGEIFPISPDEIAEYGNKPGTIVK